MGQLSILPNHQQRQFHNRHRPQVTLSQIFGTESSMQPDTFGLVRGLNNQIARILSFKHQKPISYFKQNSLSFSLSPSNTQAHAHKTTTEQSKAALGKAKHRTKATSMGDITEYACHKSKGRAVTSKDSRKSYSCQLVRSAWAWRCLTPLPAKGEIPQ